MLLKLESTLDSNDEPRRFHCCSTVRIQRLLTSVLKQRPKRCYLPRPLHPHPIHYQTNPKETQTAASNTPLPRSLTVSARATDVCDLDWGGVQTHWLWHFESTRDIRDGNMCFVLSVSVPNNAINKAERRSSQSPRSKIRLWLWNHGRFRTPRRECAASWRKRTLCSRVQSSRRVPFV